MKVDDKNLFINVGAYRNAMTIKEKISDPASKNSVSINRGDTVALSPQAIQLQQAESIIKSISDISDEKVFALKRSINNGTYTIDEGKIADKMLREIANDIPAGEPQE
jgi:negative regulator of flagellin synthesis FlgM